MKPFQGIIYLITNLINGMVYVGQTIQSISIRWNEHVCCKSEEGFYLHNAIKRYKKENFKIEEICKVDNQEDLDFLEVLFIAAHHATDNNYYGYNLRDGGSRGAHSEFSKKLMSERAKNLPPRSLERRKNQGIASKRNWENLEYRKKQKEAHEGKPLVLTPAREAYYIRRKGVCYISEEVRKRTGRINSTKRRTQAEKDHLRELNKKSPSTKIPKVSDELVATIRSDYGEYPIKCAKKKHTPTLVGLGVKYNISPQIIHSIIKKEGRYSN